MATIDPRQLITQQFFAKGPEVDNRSQLVQALTGAITQGRADAGQRRQQQAFGAGAQALFSGTETQEQIADLFARDPGRAKSLVEGAGAFTSQGQQKLADAAFSIQSMQNPQQRDAALQKISQEMQSSGADPSVFASLIGQPANVQNSTLQGLQSAVLSVKERADLAAGDRSFGLDERRTAAQERNIRSQITERGKPKPVAFTTKAKDLMAAGFIPGTPEFQQQMLTLLVKPTGTTVNIGGETIPVEDQIKIAVATKRAEEEAKAQGKNRAAFQKADVESGMTAAQSIPAINRSIDLLKNIKTGGFDSVKLRAKQFLGVESADEAELFFNLRKSVLAQLKPTFGGSFTAAEGQLLQDIEASTDKSTAGNIRLLKRGLALANKRAKIGIRAAREGRDTRSADVIQGFISSEGINLPGITLDTLTGDQLLNMTAEELEALLEN